MNFKYRERQRGTLNSGKIYNYKGSQLQKLLIFSINFVFVWINEMKETRYLVLYRIFNWSLIVIAVFDDRSNTLNF